MRQTGKEARFADHPPHLVDDDAHADPRVVRRVRVDPRQGGRRRGIREVLLRRDEIWLPPQFTLKIRLEDAEMYPVYAFPRGFMRLLKEG